MTIHTLEGKQVVITRAGAQANELAERLRELGAVPLLHPAIAIAPPLDVAPLDKAIQDLIRYDWLIVTSANGARALLDRIHVRSVPLHTLHAVRLGAIGPATAAVLAEHGLALQFVPSEHMAEAALAQIGDVQGKRVLLPCADIARDTLAAGLRERGAVVDVVVAYRTVLGPGGASLLPLLRAGEVDATTFTSASTVRYLLKGLVGAGVSPDEACALLNTAAIVCIGPITARAARDEGLRVDVEATVYTAEGLVDALVAWFDNRQL